MAGVRIPEIDTWAADELNLPSELEELRRIGPWFDTIVPYSSAQASSDGRTAILADMELAVCEIATNCIVHLSLIHISEPTRPY